MSEPYYEDDFVRLFLGDFRKSLKWNEADCLITDPPYGGSYKSNAKRSASTPRSIEGDTSTELRDEALRIWFSSGSRAALVFGSWKERRPENTKMLLVWDTKGALGMGDLSIPWKPAHQEIYVLGNGPWRGNRTSDVLVCPPVQSTAANGRLHINQKPLALMHELIASTYGTVADPFAGSGSTLIAARQAGRKAIGFEISEAHAETAAKRLERETESAFEVTA